MLPSCGQIFEKFNINIFSEIFSFIIENNLISSDQPSFKSAEASCTKQLLSIAHKIVTLLMKNLKKEVFFLISKNCLIKIGTRLLSSE